MTFDMASHIELQPTERGSKALYNCKNGKIEFDLNSPDDKGILKHNERTERYRASGKQVSFIASSLQKYMTGDNEYGTFSPTDKYSSYAEKARQFFKTFPKKSTIDDEEESIPFDEDLGKGFLLIILTDVLFSFAVIASQMTSRIEAVYDLNILRLSLQLVLSLVLAYIWGAPIFLNCGHAFPCVCIVLFNCVFQAMYFRSTAYLAVGDMVGLSVGIVIILAALVDSCFRRLTWATVVSTLVCCPGIILIVQPWTGGMTIPVPIISPCKIITDRHALPHVGHMTDYVKNITTLPVTATEELIINETLTNDPTMAATKYVSSVDEFFIFLSPVIGYIMVTVASVSFVINAKTFKYLVDMYHPLSICCWVNSMMFLIALVTSFDMNTFSFPGVTNYFSKGWLCSFFRILFIIGAASYQITYQCSLSFLQVSQAAVGQALSLVILFFCQVTFLTEIHPTINACLKGVGVCFTFVGAIFAPMVKIYKRYLKSSSNS